MEPEPLSLKYRLSAIICMFLIIIITIMLFYRKDFNIILLGFLLVFIILFFILYSIEFNKKDKENRKYLLTKYNSLPGSKNFKPFGNVWINGYKDKMILLLQKFVDICDSMNPPVPVILIYGSLLGWARHNKTLIPWDDDMDVIIPEKDYERVKLEIEKYSDVSYRDRNGYFLKIWFNSPDLSEVILFPQTAGEKSKQRWPFLDIFTFANDGSITQVDGIRYNINPEPNEWFEDEFESVKIKIPKRYKDVLDNLYTKNWYKDCISSSFCHRTERHIDKKHIKKIACAKLD